VDLIVRPLEERDFSACLDLLRGHLAYPASVLPELPGVWRNLLREDAVVAAVAESGSLDGKPGSILACGMVVFVTDAWMAASRTSQEPYLTVRTIRQELAGSSPILRPPAIRRDSLGSGLNVLHLHYVEALLSEEVRPALDYRMRLAFVEDMRGYRVKAALIELWDEVPPHAIKGGPYPVVTDYAAYFERRGEPSPPPGRRPFLLGVTRQEVLADFGRAVAPAFVYTPPRLGFTRAEQRMLRQAVFGYTDVELARRFTLALPTIKNRWRGLYDRLARIAPDLGIDLSPSSEVRGQEKRRRLLEYVRRHPEELRPGLWRTRPNRKGSTAG
jgi:DNA-binding CsgD family transcriptional regulator